MNCAMHVLKGIGLVTAICFCGLVAVGVVVLTGFLAAQAIGIPASSAWNGVVLAVSFVLWLGAILGFAECKGY